jgi:hypothetical protein
MHKCISKKFKTKPNSFVGDTMKIAVLGGTGHIGVGIALRFAMLGHEVIVGSRELEKANAKAKEYKAILEKKGVKGNIVGMRNEDAAKEAEISIFTIPYKHAYPTAEALKESLKGKVVVSPIVPMEKKGRFFFYTPPDEGSAAQKLASILTESRIVSAFQTIPAEKFANLNSNFEWDILVSSDDDGAKRKVIELINQIGGLRAVDAGPLAASRLVESITPLLINIMLRNEMRDIGVKFV